MLKLLWLIEKEKIQMIKDYRKIIYTIILLIIVIVIGTILLFKNTTTIGTIKPHTYRYKVVVPELPLFTMPLLTTSVKTLAKYIQKFIKYKKFEKDIKNTNRY